MNCPKLWFNINREYEVLVPCVMQNHILDKKFRNDEKILKLNKANYNNYTKTFIKTELDNNTIGAILYYYSDNYVFDHEKFTFNFNEIKVGNYSEYSIGNSVFDPSKDYGDISSSGSCSHLLDTIKEKYEKPSINDGFYVTDNNWNFLVRNILKKTNTILIGPTGTGKTELVLKVADCLGIECAVYDMGSMMDPLTDLLGSHRLVNGSSIFDYAKFTQDIQEPKIILLDELSRAPLTTNNILFPCLDSRRSLPVEIADSNSKRSIKVNPNCVFIATANIGSEYSGTNEIDAALMNRFVPLKLEYLDAKTEEKLVCKRTNISQGDAKKLVTIMNDIRSSYYKNEISKSVSTRESIICGELVYDGFSILDAITNVVCNKYSDDSFSNEYQIVKKIIMKY